MLVKLIHLVLSKTRVTVVNVTEPPLRGVGSCGDGSFLDLFHYDVGYNRTDWGTDRTSKNLFVVVAIIFEVIVVRILADLVMEEIEATAISTFSHPPKWWFRYVDDSHSCSRKDQVNEFLKDLNSINPNIQFTLEPEEE